MALSGEEKRELDQLETAQRIYGILTPEQQKRLKELHAKSDAGGLSPEATQIMGPAITPDNSFLQWAASKGLTAEDFQTDDGAAFLRWAQQHRLTGADFAQPGVAGAGAPGGAPAALTDAQVRDRINLLGFGWLADDPDVGPLLVSLAKGEIDQTTFNGKLRQTGWWKNHSESVRQWDTLVHTDPATANAQRAGMLAQIRNQASALGLADPDIYRQVTERALRFGLNAEQVQDMLAKEVDFGRAKYGGAASAIQAVKQLEHEYATPLSTQTRRGWARKLISGDLDTAGLTAQFVNYARSAFDGNDEVLDALDRGVTVRQYATPYIELAARELGVNPNDVDLLDRKWGRAMHSRRSDGHRGPMSLDQWGTEIRSNPIYGWEYTRNANEELSGDIFEGAA